ncbi:ATP-binding protein [Candidatus Saccharibacteria bacterium]|nr:ATP-binding protein [Candidatus Saccharibacteria bacterium]
MKRKITEKMLDWKMRSHGETALLVVGARRVGKSYIVEEFARKNYRSYLLIDFTKASEQVKKLFQEQTDDLDTFFTMLQTYYNVRFYERDTVLIFDEVQAFPRAREMVKHFVADGRYDYIETGSLMSIKENVKDILIPSEEQEIEMYPMDFEEFLINLDAGLGLEGIKYFYEVRKPLGQALHRKMMTLFRQYLITGGMPQAVQKFIETKNFREVDAVKRRILTLYNEDIEKHGGKDALRVKQIFNLIPAQLSKANKRFMFSEISEVARYREYENALIWLSEAKIVNLCFNTMEPMVGLTSRMDISAFKCYQADVGLLISQTFETKDLAKEEIYKKILFDKLEFNNGMVMENAVAQMLAAAGHKLYYYAETTDRMEVDFLVTKQQITARKNVVAIEVKSGKGYSINSLNKYREKFAQQVGEVVVLHDGDLKVEDGVTYLPVYMAGLL